MSFIFRKFYAMVQSIASDNAVHDAIRVQTFLAMILSSCRQRITVAVQ